MQSAPVIPPPDWGLLVEEVHCPLCDYNLRGLTESRCPECGFSFQWPDLLDPKRRLHPYLFEHHPERSIGSFFQTVIGGLRPRRFWSSLHPVQPSNRRRLAIYLILSSLPLLIIFCVQAGFGTVAETLWRFGNRTPASYGWIRAANGPRSLSLIVVGLNLRRWLEEDRLSQFLLVCLVWPWLTLAGLSVFRWSIRRARIRQIHVWRTIVYSSDLFLIASPLLALATISFWINPIGSGGSRWPVNVLSARSSFFDPFVPYLALILVTVFSYRLVQAYRYYLRFDHVVATVICAQFMVLLVVMKLIFVLNGY